MPAPAGTYMLNYNPVNNPGYSMWEAANYNGATYEADMIIAKNLGFNTLRVNLATIAGVFDFPSPTTAELDNLTDFYNRSKTAGIQLRLCVLNEFGNYGQISHCETWLTAVLGALPDFTNIHSIELQNEAAFASTAAYSGGFDAGWTASQPTATGPVLLGFWQYLAAWMTANYPSLKVTISCTNGSADISALVSNVAASGNAPDWYEWHCYTKRPYDYTIFSALQQIQQIVGNGNLFIGECGSVGGSPSGDNTTSQTTWYEQREADYTQAVRWACQQLGIPEPAPWQLYDTNDNPGAQFPNGTTWGLLNVNGGLKPKGEMYTLLPPGTFVPPVDTNPSMLGSSQLDPNGNPTVNRWTTYLGSSGSQPITTAIDTVNVLNSAPAAMLLTGSGASVSPYDAALETDPSCWPPVAFGAGQSYTFSVWLKAAGNYQNGSATYPRLTISWYNFATLGSVETFISSTNGGQLTLTGSYVKYTITSTCPSTASYARLFVEVGQNNGSIWVGGATWAGPAPRLLAYGGYWYRQT
jgi:hypothetical protein